MSFGPPPSIYTQSALSAEQTKRKRRRRVVIGFVAAVVALAVPLSGWLLWPVDQGGGEKKPSVVRQAPDEVRESVEKPPVAPEGVLAAQVSEEVKGKRPLYTPGTWATGKLLVKGIADHLFGFTYQDKDDPEWTLPLGGHICAITDHVTADGRTAVVIQPKGRSGTPGEGVCDQVAFVDLNTGKKLWQKPMPSADFAYVTNVNITLTKGVVAVAWGRGSVAYDMNDGKQLWNGTTTSKCEDSGFAGGRVLLALVTCGELPDVTYRVQKLTPSTGKVEWTYKVAAGVSSAYLPSSDPPVLAVAAGDSSVTDLISLDSRGKYRTTISLEGYEASCGTRHFSRTLFGTVDKCESLVVGRDQAFVTSEEHFDTNQPKNWIIAFDLKTGRTTGKFEGRPFQPVYPVQMSGDDLLIFRDGGGLDLAALVSWNPRTDKETPYFFFQLTDDYELSEPEHTDMFMAHGKLIFARRQVERDDQYPDDAVTVALAYSSPGLKH